MGGPSRFAPEVRERAERMVPGHQVGRIDRRKDRLLGGDVVRMEPWGRGERGGRA